MSIERIMVNGRELTAFDLPPEPSDEYTVHVDGLGEIVVQKGKPPSKEDVPAEYMRKMVVGLCERIIELESDNDELQKEVWALESAGEAKDMESAKLERENAELRELVADMWFWGYCGHMDGKSQEWQMEHIDGVLQRIRELGITEVS